MSTASDGCTEFKWSRPRGKKGKTINSIFLCEGKLRVTHFWK
jgi:hypothetical protein